MNLKTISKINFKSTASFLHLFGNDGCGTSESLLVDFVLLVVLVCILFVLVVLIVLIGLLLIYAFGADFV